MRVLRRAVAYGALVALALAGRAGSAASAPQVAFDHVWVVVSVGAPERIALERAGFRVAPTVNHHDGSGTSSVTIEFLNAYLELMWPDPKVSVAQGNERGPEKFRQRMLWRTSGWCPFGIGLHRLGSSTEPLPLPAWQIRAPWLRKGSAIDVLTPKDDTKSPSIFVEPRYLAVDAAANEKAAGSATADGAFQHPCGARRITRIKLVMPTSFAPTAPVTFLRANRIVELFRGEAWLLELTLDDGAQQKTKDLRPDLPLILHF